MASILSRYSYFCRVMSQTHMAKHSVTLIIKFIFAMSVIETIGSFFVFMRQLSILIVVIQFVKCDFTKMPKALFKT